MPAIEEAYCKEFHFGILRYQTIPLKLFQIAYQFGDLISLFHLYFTEQSVIIFIMKITNF